MPLDPCQDLKSAYGKQMQLVSEVLTSHVPGAIVEDERTILVDLHAEKLVDIETSLFMAGWERSANGTYNVWTWNREKLWQNPCQELFAAEPRH